MELTERLMALASEVKKGQVVADIGTDHGYLPIYLVKSGIAPKVYASDINRGPLQACIDNARASGVEDRIVTGQGSGTEPIQGMDVDLVIIAGMGGQLIKGILIESKELLYKGIPFLLQPMQQQRDLRKYLYKNNYRVEKDALVEEGKKIYEFLKIRYTGTSNLKDRQDTPNRLSLDVQYELGFYLKDQPKKLRDRFILQKLSQQEKILAETKGKSGQQIQRVRAKALNKKNRLEEVLQWP